MFKAGHGEWSEERENSCASSQLKVFILLNGWREKKKMATAGVVLAGAATQFTCLDTPMAYLG